MLAVRDLRFAHDSRVLLKNASMTIADNERVALWGRNGAGKSTLLALLSGKLPPDGGVIERGRDQRIGVLAQEPDLDHDATIEEILAGTDAAEHRIDEVRTRLGIGDKHRKVGELSGGQRRRLDLARLLLEEPDALLMDEPTNHLDSGGIAFLGNTLKRHRGPVIVISHDRAFVDDVCTRVVELEGGELFSYTTPRDSKATLTESYLEQKLLRDDVKGKTQQREEQLLLRELAWVRAGTPARTTKQTARLDRADKLEQQVEERAAEIRHQKSTVAIEQEQTKRLGKTIVDFQDVSLARGEQPLFSGLSLAVTKGQRWGILGGNGAGKTTLLVALAHACRLDVPGQLPRIVNGRIVVGDNTDAALFDQHRASLDGEATLQETLSGKNDHVIINGRRIHIAGWLERFLFDGRDKDRRVKTLSGGEQNRLVLAKLFLSGKNVLLLDEPTNDLDVATLGVLEEALMEHEGCAFIVSHDRRFLDRVVTGILAFELQGESNVVIPVIGDYTHYYRTRGDLAAAAQKAGAAAQKNASAAGSPSSQTAKPRKRSYKEEAEFTKMEETILVKESARDTLRTELADTTLFRTDPAKAAEMTKRLQKMDAEIEQIYTRWAELSSLSAM
jgi:ABC transport system ATP-binding/permease protein